MIRKYYVLNYVVKILLIVFFHDYTSEQMRLKQSATLLMRLQYA